MNAAAECLASAKDLTEGKETKEEYAFFLFFLLFLLLLFLASNIEVTLQFQSVLRLTPPHCLPLTSLSARHGPSVYLVYFRSHRVWHRGDRLAIVQNRAAYDLQSHE